MYNGIYGE
jgi:hypothetical protein